MAFMEKMKKHTLQETEKGGLGYASSGKALVDLNFAIPSFRDGIDKELFEKALQTDTVLTLKWLLYLRDIREGVGERKSFRDFMRYLAKNHTGLARSIIQKVHIEEYGRWDDYIALLEDVPLEVQKSIMYRIASQWTKDVIMCEKGESISLLSKWLPSENASSQRTRTLAKFVRKSLGITPKEYRKTLSKLRKHLDVVERKMAANDWEKIDYKKVPSKANLIYSNAFYRHDEDRRQEYLSALQKGKAKINAQALFLHDIIHKYRSKGWQLDVDQTLEEMWKAQKKVEGFKDTLVVRDGSGSMTCQVGNSGVTAIDVADALTLYCAENNSGEFKNKFVTFSRMATVVEIAENKTLRQKMRYLAGYHDYDTTNIESVFNLVLRTAIEEGMTQEDLPKNILIISDMEIDDVQRYDYGEKASLEVIADRYRQHGFELPKMIFWNVNSRTNTIPITQNKNGVILLSGFSKNLMSMVMSSSLDPYTAIVAELNKPRYSVVDTLDYSL